MELFLALEECVSNLKIKPDAWKIEISKGFPDGKPHYAIINRAVAIEKLEHLMRVANEAYNDNRKLLFIRRDNKPNKSLHHQSLRALDSFKSQF